MHQKKIIIGDYWRFVRRGQSETKILSLITEVIVEPAHKSDTDALISLIEATQRRGLGPQQALVDAVYGRAKNTLSRIRGILAFLILLVLSRNDSLSV